VSDRMIDTSKYMYVYLQIKIVGNLAKMRKKTSLEDLIIEK